MCSTLLLPRILGVLGRVGEGLVLVLGESRIDFALVAGEYELDVCVQVELAGFARGEPTNSKTWERVRSDGRVRRAPTLGVSSIASSFSSDRWARFVMRPAVRT